MIMTFWSDRNMKTLPTPHHAAMPFWAFLLVTLCLVPISPAESADQEREDRLTEEMEANLFDGDVISLLPDGGTFAAVEMESQADSTRGGHHPAAWPGISRRLAREYRTPARRTFRSGVAYALPADAGA